MTDLLPGQAEATPEVTALRDTAHLMIALRAHGLDMGGMSGFDDAGVDAAFFAGTAVKSRR